MKKIACLILAVIVAAGILTACGSDSSQKADQQTTVAAAADKQATDTQAAQDTAQAPADQDVQANAETEQTAQEAGRYTFVYKGTNIDLKADAAPILAALGEPKSYTEETSCAFDGLDKNYTYPSFIMTTYPDGDMDRVNSVTVLDDTVSTTDGIYINDSKERVEEVYGAEFFNGVNAYIMKDGDVQLTVIVDNDKVSSIQYNYQPE